MMDIDEALRDVEKQIKDSHELNSLKSKFYDLSGEQFERSVLGEVHEYTIEDILNKQAEGFYKGFPTAIKKELVYEFIEMEHQLRRDRFFSFCLHLYKQIECCINYSITSTAFIEKLRLVRKNPIYQNENVGTDQLTNQLKKYIRKHGDNVQYSFLKYYDRVAKKWLSVADWNNLFEGNNIQISQMLLKLDFPNKFKLVLYIVKHNASVSESIFENDLIVFESIRQSRHMAHGGKMSDTEQKIIDGQDLDEKETLFINAHKNRYVNYFLYHGFLIGFVENVSKF
ncbi:hypothetical protein [Fibrella aquatica]|uniref:hypothetical protein n=1 Tax=Fibrella aquatica TaxID=3242487 RepID=UPI0035215563